ncbi:Ldh family oxidoreductase [Candidatus Poriferisocius sp.]|uniref:Ldh family oxidoreductase n=1 Tax=Candidatus Poriferisocius sp. TaxID=3101276 RepID=UPI003B02C6A4
MIRLDHRELKRYEIAIFERLGVPPDQAEIVADNLVEADLRGVDSHGAHLVELYVARLRSGHLRPVTEVMVIRDDGATMMLDGGIGFGQVSGLVAMELAVERAKTHGVAAVTVREGTHLGALAYYTLPAAEAGCFAMAMQNGPTIVPPYGGRAGIFSTNPFSWAAPAGEELPVVYDIATTTVAGNKILLAKNRGDPTIPEGWANDEQGNPTTDTVAASAQNLCWFGGYKGFGVAMMVEVLSGIVAGSSFGHTEQTDCELVGTRRLAKGWMFLTLDLERFCGLDRFREQMDQLIRDVHATERAEDVDRIYVPGEIEHENRATRLASGIPLPTTLVDRISTIGAELGLPAL